MPFEQGNAAYGASARLWLIAIVIMAVCAAALAWFPLLSIEALPSKNYNEGWNAYRQWMALQGRPLYGAPPGLFTTNYPFLSFHIIAWLGAAKDKMVLAGRVVCFASLIAVSLFVGGIIRRISGSKPGAIYAALCMFVWLGAFNGPGRAYDDPELLSIGFACAGLYAYLHGPRQAVWLAVAAVAFALSLFTKHDAVTLAASVGIHLIVTRNWRGLGVLLGAGAVASGLLLSLSYHLDGPYFFTALLQPRAYGGANLVAETLHYLLHFVVPLVIGLVCLWRSPTMPQRGFLATLLLVTNAAAIYFSGGDGVGSNIFYPPLIADLLACVAAICWWEQGARRGAYKTALVLSTLAGAVMMPFQLNDDCIAYARLPGVSAAARQAVALLSAAQGPAICEDLLLCYEAGKPLGFDPYYVHDQILIGRMDEAGVLALLKSHQFGAVQIDRTLNAAALAHRRGGRFTPAFLHTLLAAYRPVLVTGSTSVFVPR